MPALVPRPPRSPSATVRCCWPHRPFDFSIGDLSTATPRTLPFNTPPPGDREEAGGPLASPPKQELRLTDAMVAAGNEQCAVCFEDQAAGDEAVVLLCNHAFHEGCIGPWLAAHSTCPVCRQPAGGAGAGGPRREQQQQQQDQDQRRRQRESRLGGRSATWPVFAPLAVRPQEPGRAATPPPTTGRGFPRPAPAAARGTARGFAPAIGVHASEWFHAAASFGEPEFTPADGIRHLRLRGSQEAAAQDIAQARAQAQASASESLSASLALGDGDGADRYRLLDAFPHSGRKRKPAAEPSEPAGGVGGAEAAGAAVGYPPAYPHVAKRTLAVSVDSLVARRATAAAPRGGKQPRIT